MSSCTCGHLRHFPGGCPVADPETVACGCMWGRPSEIDVDRLARAMALHYGKSVPMFAAASGIAREYAALGRLA